MICRVAFAAVAVLATVCGAAVAQNCCSSGGSGSGGTILLGYTPPVQPSSERSPRENLEILLDRAKSEVREQEGYWLRSGESLNKARAKVDAYKRFLGEIE